MDSPIRLVPFRREHYEQAVGPIMMNGTTPGVTGTVYERGGPAFTGMIGDQIAGCAGVLMIWPGVAEAWALLTDLGKEFPVLATDLVRTGLETIATGMRLHRVQADVLAGFPLHQRWVERLGFVFESRMPKYGPAGEDFVRYVWLP